MGELRDKQVIKTNPVFVDPMFALPKDLDEGEYGFGGSDRPEFERRVEVGVGPDGGTQPVRDAPLPPPSGYLGDAPSDLRVKSQTFKFSPDGSYVVDVILEFSDVIGASSYEVRVAA